MPISTLQTQRESNMPKSKIITYIVAAAGVVGILYFGGMAVKSLIDSQKKGAVSVASTYSPAEVLINGVSMGTAPYKARDLKVGESKITIKNANNDRRYEVSLNFLPNVEVVLNRDLGVSEAFSSGQNLWMEKSSSGTGVSVISEPSGASVFIDNTEVGKTPYSSSSLTDDDYDLRIEYPGYEAQSTRIKGQKGYNLNISATLFPNPVPPTVTTMTGADSLYDLSSDNNLLITDTESWVKAVVYWNQTRGVNLAGAGVNKDLVFDYFLDYKGNVYEKNGVMLSNSADYSKLKDAKKGAYLGKKADGAGLSEQAKTAFQTLSTGVVSAAGGKIATIKTTETGWLRVRNAGSLTGTEIAKVNTGGKYSVLETAGDWVKIKVSDTVQGWVSKAYVTLTDAPAAAPTQ